MVGDHFPTKIVVTLEKYVSQYSFHEYKYKKKEKKKKKKKISEVFHIWEAATLNLSLCPPLEMFTHWLNWDGISKICKRQCR